MKYIKNLISILIAKFSLKKDIGLYEIISFIYVGSKSTFDSWYNVPILINSKKVIKSKKTEKKIKLFFWFLSKTNKIFNKMKHINFI